MKSISTNAVLLVTLLSSSTNAFAPSSFTQSSTRMSQTNNGSMLQMNLFDRFSRVAKANLNNVVKSLEDPEKILNQAVEDMQVSGSLLDERFFIIYIYIYKYKEFLFVSFFFLYLTLV